MSTPRQQRFLFAWLAASTMLGLMGTDLILPTVPFLPDALGGGATGAQMTLAAYAAGIAAGLLVFGALADRIATGALLVGAMVALAAVSLICTLVDDLAQLVAMRAVQGVTAAAPAVFAPGIIRAMLPENRAVRAIGLLGSFEALAPALAPIVGAWLLAVGSWSLPFEFIAAIALLLAVALRLAGNVPQVARRTRGRYLRLLCDAVFLRYALSHAFVLGGLLTFVFGMPAVFVLALGGSTKDFIFMQAFGIGAFVVIANIAGHLAERFGTERVITWGTLVSAAGALAMLIYAVSGGSSTFAITILFVPINAGLGLRGPPGFFRAVQASRGDDARGSALVVLAVLGMAAAGTMIAAPWIERGLAPLTAISCAFHAGALLSLLALPRLDTSPGRDSAQVVEQ